jgi:hypothetical protein
MTKPDPKPRRLVLTKETLRVLTGIQAGPTTTGGPATTTTRVMTEDSYTC